VHCIASPDPRANAVGTLELECTADGLQLVYLGLSAYRPGYAPGPPATGSQCVPWTGVRVSMVGARQLLLELDPALGPHRRLLVSHVRPSAALPPLEQRRRRMLLLASTIALVLLFALAWWSPRAQTTGWPRVAAALAALVAAAIVVMLAGFSRSSAATVNEPDADAFLELSEALCRHVPGFLPEASAPESEPPQPFWSPTRLEQSLPRTAVGIAIALSACGLATILTSVWLLRTPARALSTIPSTREPAKAVDPQRVEVEAARPAERAPVATLIETPGEPARGDGLALGAPCECARPASILWDRGVPRLTTIVSGRRDGWEKNRPHIRFDLSVVNNGDRALERLSLRVVFYDDSRKNPSGRRVVEEQYFFDPGPLPPGRSIVWRAQGQGSSFEVLAPELGKLDEHGTQAAPADAFDRLARERPRALRLHASMMLAFLGDERARQHALELQAEGRELEGPYLERVLHAVSPLRVCEVLASSEGSSSHTIECCVQNVGKRPHSALRLRVRGVDGRDDVQIPLAPPPLVFAESGYRIAGELRPRTGHAVELSFETAPTSPSPLLLEYLLESDVELR
jgi:hypothetical protein